MLVWGITCIKVCGIKIKNDNIKMKERMKYEVILSELSLKYSNETFKFLFTFHINTCDLTHAMRR